LEESLYRAGFLKEQKIFYAKNLIYSQGIIKVIIIDILGRGYEGRGLNMIGSVIKGEEDAKKWFNGSMTLKEATEYLGLSRYMIRKMVKEDKIPYTYIYKNILFHKTIIDSWMRGEFTPGRVEIIVDEESIKFDYLDALKEHYERYPHLKEKITYEPQKASVTSEYQYRVNHDGVQLTVGSIETGIVVQAFLTHSAIDELYKAVQKYKSGRVT
jgi:excisionase family DNA binding protein